MSHSEECSPRSQPSCRPRRATDPRHGSVLARVTRASTPAPRVLCRCPRFQLQKGVCAPRLIIVSTIKNPGDAGRRGRGAMCFKNLPVEFDSAGKARLKAGVLDPYSVKVAEPKSYVRRAAGPGTQLA